MEESDEEKTNNTVTIKYMEEFFKKMNRAFIEKVEAIQGENLQYKDVTQQQQEEIRDQLIGLQREMQEKADNDERRLKRIEENIQQRSLVQRIQVEE